MNLNQKLGKCGQFNALRILVQSTLKAGDRYSERGVLGWFEILKGAIGAYDGFLE